MKAPKDRTARTSAGTPVVTRLDDIQTPALAQDSRWQAIETEAM